MRTRSFRIPQRAEAARRTSPLRRHRQALRYGSVYGRAHGRAIGLAGVFNEQRRGRSGDERATMQTCRAQSRRNRPREQGCRGLPTAVHFCEGNGTARNSALINSLSAARAGRRTRKKLGGRRVVAKLVEQFGFDAPDELALARAAPDGVVKFRNPRPSCSLWAAADGLKRSFVRRAGGWIEGHRRQLPLPSFCGPPLLASTARKVGGLTHGG
jgi:hypothetical protein